MVEKPYSWTIGDPTPPLEDHTQIKHSIVRSYTERYIDIVTQNRAQKELNFTIVDGFAGGGRYRRDGLIVPGSPLILLDTVRNSEEALNQERAKGFQIKSDFFFVEQHPRTFDFLVQTISESRHAADLGKSIHLINDDFNHHADAIISRIKAKGSAHRSLFLLDQCGWGDVPLKTVRKVYHELKHSEVFLTFGMDSLIDYLSDKTSEFRAAISAELSEGLIADLISIRESEQVGWRALVQHGLYKHLRQRTDAKFASPFFLMSNKSHRSLWFLHLSKHWRARDEIGLIHWNSARGSVDHRGDAGFKPLGFTPERKRDLSQLAFDFGFDESAKRKAHDALEQQLCDAIIDLIEREQQPPTVERIFSEHCNDSPVTSPMLMRALQTLRDQGELEVRRENRLRRTGSSIDFGDHTLRTAQRSLPGILSRPKK